ncbi:hypothetical protein LCGC14_3049520, partial [marine sediment metagenome]
FRRYTRSKGFPKEISVLYSPLVKIVKNKSKWHVMEDENDERMTYPEFNRFDDGRIMVDFRNRGSGNGNDLFSFYDGKGWSKMFQYNNGNQPNKMNYNFYGSFKFMHGKLYQGGSIRYGLANSDDNFKYDGNNGLFLAYADALFRDVDRLYVTYGRVNENPLGAGPIGGTSIPIDRKSTAKMLGFHGIIENSIDATSTRDFVIEYVAAVAILMTNLSRISEDFAIWSTSEFSFIELSDEFTSPSSVMPQKKNPDLLELTRGKTAQVIGNLTTILTTVKGLASGYNRDLQQIKSSIWSTSKISTDALLVIKLMLMTVTVNKEKMKKAAESGNLIALDLAEKLVLKGIPFRISHNVIG